MLSHQKEVTMTTGGPEVFNYLVDIGYDKRLGARPMKGAIEREVGDAWVRFLASEHRNEKALVLTKEVGVACLTIVPQTAFSPNHKLSVEHYA